MVRDDIANGGSVRARVTDREAGKAIGRGKRERVAGAKEIVGWVSEKVMWGRVGDRVVAESGSAVEGNTQYPKRLCRIRRRATGAGGRRPSVLARGRESDGRGAVNRERGAGTYAARSIRPSPPIDTRANGRRGTVHAFTTSASRHRRRWCANGFARAGTAYTINGIPAATAPPRHQWVYARCTRRPTYRRAYTVIPRARELRHGRTGAKKIV